MDVLTGVISATWDMLYQAGLYVVIGLLAAGLVHILVSRAFLTRHLGGKGFWPVVKAALVGAPLPLCSCSVLPTAFALRERGAGRGATVSFLISTPETSFDSIAVTWALMGPLMAIVRPVAAVLTALGAGFAEAFRGRHEPEPAPPAPACPHCASDDCEHVETPGRLRRFWQFVVFEMADEIGPTLALGLLLAGLVAAFVPEAFFTTYLGNRWASMGIMLLVGLPLYVCATASTPLAAALMMKGLNPGAALVFLLVGPATNLATILTVGKMLGKASAALYVAMIVAFSLLFGAALDTAVDVWKVNIHMEHVHGYLPAWVQTAGGIVLGLYLAHAVARWIWRKWPRQAKDACCHSANHM
ncbi:MAG TPA: SO_0444 family Cu/Zn efflux transporter [Phycisphaerae bacterium]|nr:SO_0444 family Cu/Zn efflux transporter [Phycisphaerae bacterium]